MSPEQQRDQLIVAYQEMADLTKLECGPVPCGQKHCCTEGYCIEAIRWARRRWDVTLERTSHPTIPLLDLETNDCTAPPHTRPICTIHTCAIASAGFKRDDPDWTQRYFELRETLENLEGTFDMLNLVDDELD